MTDKADRKSTPAGASWVPFAILASLALGNLLDKPPLESERPTDGYAEKPNAARSQGFPEALNGDPLKALMETNLDEKAMLLVQTKDAKDVKEPIPVKAIEGVLDVRSKILVVPVIVNGGSGAVECERRRRTRYAVVSGLARAGLVPLDSRHIGVSCLNIPLTSPSAVPAPMVPVTFERFGPDDVVGIGKQTMSSSHDADAVLSYVTLVWINSDDLTHRRIDSLFLALRKAAPKQTLDLRCIAAVGTDAVIRIVENLTKDSPGLELGAGGKEIPVFLPRATAPTANIWRSAATRTGDKLAYERNEWKRDFNGVKFCVPEVIHHKSSAKGGLDIRFVRTLCDDVIMLDLIEEELQLRGRSVKSDPRNVMLLVGEWDTSYSRALKQRFLEIHEKDTNRILSIAYVRGVDEGLGNNGGAKGVAAGKPGGGSPEITGESQMDYIRRAEQEMAFVNLLRQASGQRVTAIGILGTDIYDKIVILQAVKQVFPTSVVFTTDLDAMYTDPTRYERNRNLLVGSTYGLALDSALQGAIPPFRESLQTSTYFATLQAVGFDCAAALRSPGDSPGKEPLTIGYAPRVFEIGRSGAFDLTGGLQFVKNVKRVPLDEILAYAVWAKETGAPAASSLVVDINQRSQRGAVFKQWVKTHVWTIVGAIVSVFVLAFVMSEKLKRCVYAVPSLVKLRRGRSLALISVLTFLTAAALLGVVYCYRIVEDPKEEPVLLFEGISVWPSIALRFAVIAVSAVAAYLIYNMRWSIPAADGLPRDKWEETAIAGFAGSSKKRSLTGLYKLFTATPLSRWNRTSMELTGQDIDAPHCADGRIPDPDRRYSGIDFEELHRRLDGKLLMGRVLAVLAVLAIGAAVVDLPDSPARGSARHWDKFLGILSWLAATGVVVLADGVLRTVRRFVELIREEYRDQFQKQARACDPELSLACLRGCQRLRDVSRVALNCLYAPSIVVLLLTLCYNPLFDAWHWSIWLPLPFLVLSAVLIFNAWSLGRTAMQVRRDIVERLRDSVECPEVKDAKDLKETVRSRIDRILSLDGGAFTRFLDMPLVRAIMIPISGAGGISAIQYMTPFLG